MQNNVRMHLIAACLVAAVALWLAMHARCAAETLHKVGPATVTATQYAPDGKEVGKASELTDGDAGTSWLFHPAVPEKDLPLRLVLVMDAPHAIGKVRIANYFIDGQSIRRGVKVVDLFVGEAQAPATGGTPAMGDVTVKESDAAGSAWTDVVLPKPMTGRYVTLRVKSNWGASNYGVNEVEIYTEDGTAPAGTSGKPATPPTTTTTTPPSTTQATTPGASTGTDTVVARDKFTSYDYEEPGKQVRLIFPAGLTTIRGLLVVSSGAGGDSRDYYQETWYREFLVQHQFAFIGTHWGGSHAETYQFLLRALPALAKESGHPEVVNAPYATTGFSSGGGFASTLLVADPTRVIASVPVSARLNFTGVTPTDAHRNTPACVIAGEYEDWFPSTVETVLAAQRPQSAEFGGLTVPGSGHARGGQEVLAMPYLDACVRLRYPADADPRKGPVKLKTLDPADGWVADNTTWKSGLTTIAPAKEFKGDVTKSSWLPTEDIAFIYRAYSTYNKPLTITSPQNKFRNPPNEQAISIDPAYDPGTDMPIVVDDTKFPGWKKLEFYDDAKKLGEITQGPPQFTAKNMQPGYHVFSVLGTDAQGNIRSSQPVLVVVRK